MGNANKGNVREVLDGDRQRCARCGARRIDAQLGLELTPDAYIAAMVGVFREVRRILRDDGTLWLNVGSSYASGGKRPSQSRDARHALACDNGGIEPQGSLGSDCAYPDLGGERLDGSLTHRDHSVGIGPQTPPEPLPDAMTAHDNEHQASTDASPSLLDALVSTNLSSSENVQDVCGLASAVEASPLNGQTSPSSIHPTEHNSASPSFPHSNADVSSDQPSRTHDIEEIVGSSASRTEGKGAGSVPSCNCGSCGICFAYLAIPMLQFKAKDLMMMPHLLALALQADGWYVRSDITWSKPNPMPESCSDRPTNAHEQVFLLTKRARYFYDADAVRSPLADKTFTTFGTKHRPQGNDSGRNVKSDNWGSSLDERQPKLNADGGIAGAALRNVWTIATHAYPNAHFATFPPELAERCIKAGTSERGCCAACGAPWTRVTERGAAVPLTPSDAGRKATWTIGDGQRDPATRTDTPLPRHYRPVLDTSWVPSCQCQAETRPCVVLDPFSGAGTTALVADRLGRDAIGIDLSHAYVEMTRERLTADCPLFMAFEASPSPAEDPEETRMADLFAEPAP